MYSDLAVTPVITVVVAAVAVVDAVIVVAVVDAVVVEVVFVLPRAEAWSSPASSAWARRRPWTTPTASTCSVRRKKRASARKWEREANLADQNM